MNTVEGKGEVHKKLLFWYKCLTLFNIFNYINIFFWDWASSGGFHPTLSLSYVVLPSTFATVKRGQKMCNFHGTIFTCKLLSPWPLHTGSLEKWSSGCVMKARLRQIKEDAATTGANRSYWRDSLVDGSMTKSFQDSMGLGYINSNDLYSLMCI